MGTEPSSTSATDARVAHTGARERPGNAGPETACWDDMVLVGRVARVHGLKGQVVVAPETDFVDERFSVGSRLWSRSATGAIEALDVGSMRTQGGRPVVRFEGFADVNAASGLYRKDLFSESVAAFLVRHII